MSNNNIAKFKRIEFCIGARILKSKLLLFSSYKAAVNTYTLMLQVQLKGSNHELLPSEDFDSYKCLIYKMLRFLVDIYYKERQVHIP